MQTSEEWGKFIEEKYAQRIKFHKIVMGKAFEKTKQEEDANLGITKKIKTRTLKMNQFLIENDECIK